MIKKSAGLICFQLLLAIVLGIFVSSECFSVQDGNYSYPGGKWYSYKASENEKNQPVTSNSNGSAVYEIPISVPPGRGKVTPKIKLSYNSDGKNGILGVGWDIDLGNIRRYKKFKNYFQTYFDTYTGDELAQVNFNPQRLVAYFSPKIESKFEKYAQYIREGGRFEAVSTDGTKRFYGSSPNSRQGDGTNIFKYCLDKIEDSNGNFMSISYFLHSGQIYIDEVLYSGNIGHAPNNSVKFNYDDYREDNYESFNTNFSVTTMKRLSSIDVFTNETKSRSYSFQYIYSSSTGNSLLEKIVERGSDQIKYYEIGLEWQKDNIGSVNCLYSYDRDGLLGGYDYRDNDSGVSVARGFDYNGDGRDDLLIDDIYSNRFHIAKSLGNGQFQQAYSSTSGIGNFSFNDANDEVIPLDYNGDGKDDIFAFNTYSNRFMLIKSIGDDANGDYSYEEIFYSQNGLEGFNVSAAINYREWWSYKSIPIDYNGDGNQDLLIYGWNWAVIDRPQLGVFISNGSDGPDVFSKVYEGNFLGNFHVGDATYLLPFDYNGDGRTDIIAGNSLNDKIYVFSATNDGKFYETYSVNVSDYAIIDGTFRPVPFDFNGDGQQDILISQGSNNLILRSNGNGDFDIISESTSGLAGMSVPLQRYVTAFDYDGDGKSDLFLCGEAYGSQQKEIVIARSNGDGTFTPEVDYTYSGGSLENESIGFRFGYSPAGRAWISTLDSNGDGKQEIFHYGLDSRWEILQLGSSTHSPDLLSELSKTYGENNDENLFHYKINLEYKPSSEYQNINLPFVKQTLCKLTTNDGVSQPVVHEYSYKGGLYDLADREFRGFKETVTRNPNNTQVISKYHQGPFLKGKLEKRDTVDNESNAILKEERLFWGSQSLDNIGAREFIRIDRDYAIFYDTVNVVKENSYTYHDDHGAIHTMKTSGTGLDTPITKTYEYTNLDDSTLEIGSMWRLSLEKLEGEIDEKGTVGTLRQTEYSDFDSNGNFKYVTSINNDGEDSVIEYSYDEFGNVIREIDSRGNATNISYESQTQTFPHTITYPTTNGISHVITLEEYDYRVGKAKSVRDENGNHTVFGYDEFGRLEEVVFPDQGQIIYHFGDNSFPRYISSRKKSTDTSVVETKTFYDGLSREVQKVSTGEDGIFNVTKKHYDNMGNIAFQSGPFFHNSDDFFDMLYTESGYGQLQDAHPYKYSEYDKLNRLISQTTMDGQNGLAQTNHSYVGRFTRVTDPDQCSIIKTQDCLNRITEIVEDPDGHNIKTQYAYNAAGELIKVTDALGNHFSMTYDTLGRQIRMVDPDLGEWRYDFDANGNLIQQADAKGHRIQFSYDELNRLLTKTFPDTDDPTVTHTYDSVDAAHCIGRMHSTTNGSVTTTVNAYDPMGRKLEVEKSIAGTTNRTMNLAYDYAGRLARLTYPYIGSPGYYIDYTYYSDTNLLYSVTGADDTVLARISDYQPSGKIGNLNLGNGVTTQYDYDGWSQRLTGYQTFNPGGDTLQDRQYIYSHAGDITDIDDGAWVETYYYEYDKLHRLVSETTSGGSVGIKPGIFEMDYNDLDHIHAVSDVTILGQAYAIDYDSNGNMTSGPDLTDPSSIGQRTFTFNADNMPTQIVHHNGGTTNILYDGEAKRAKKIGTSGDATYYFNNEFELRGSTETAYIFAGNLRVAVVENGNTVTYFHKDHLGSSSIITDATGSMLEQTRYIPFGGQRGEGSGLTSTAYKFSDQEHDAETGLYNYDARLYDPVIGRFVSADSVVSDWYGPQSFNRYSYALNNPVKYVDPDGHFAVLAGFVAAKLVAVGVAWVGTEIASHSLYLADEVASDQAVNATRAAMGKVVAINESEIAGMAAGEGIGAAVGAGIRYIKNARQVRQAVKIAEQAKAPKSVGSGGRFKGTKAPWKEGATPNSVYTHYSEKSGTAIKNAVYDSNGKYVGEVNFRNHRNGYVSGHGHKAPTPGDIFGAHRPENHLMPDQVPGGWNDLPSGIKPHTSLGE